jgi:hypothetical protein
MDFLQQRNGILLEEEVMKMKREKNKTERIYILV